MSLGLATTHHSLTHHSPSLFALLLLELVLFRDSAGFHVSDCWPAFFSLLVQELIDLPLFFLTGIAEMLSHS